jgi:hypothetical protein
MNPDGSDIVQWNHNRFIIEVKLFSISLFLIKHICNVVNIVS